MAINLDGIIFGQIYGDNSGGAEFDTDGDGTPTQEDEFVSFINASGSAVDISGWQIWTDWTGLGAPDSGTDGLYHTFPPGSIIGPGQTVYVVNEITGPTGPFWQEASAGGVESGPGGISTNFISEGENGGTDSVVLVNPANGNYIVFNMAAVPSTVPGQPGFPGTTNIGVIDGNAVSPDQNAGSSYQYDAGTDSYVYDTVFVPCFTPGTLIRTPHGDRHVEILQPGDLVCTLDNGAQPIRAILVRHLDFSDPAHHLDRPVQIAAGALAPGLPSAPLTVSPQHRMLVTLACGRQMLAPAKGLLHRPGIRIKRGLARVRYIHLVFATHQVVFSNDAPSESFYGGPHIARTAPQSLRDQLPIGPTARPILRVREVAQHL